MMGCPEASPQHRDCLVFKACTSSDHDIQLQVSQCTLRLFNISRSNVKLQASGSVVNWLGTQMKLVSRMRAELVSCFHGSTSDM